MREQVFVGRRQAGWERLETLLREASARGIKALPAADLRELALLYRAATTDLAAAQSRAYTQDLRSYLNRLVARAYSVIHVSAADPGWKRVASFFTTVFPREVRRCGGIIAATTLLFIVATIVSYWLVAIHPNNVYALMPESGIPKITKSLHDSNFGFDRAYGPMMSSEIITNNIRVTMLAFAGGMTLGVVTIWEILNNGLMLGGLGALFASKGFGSDFWATISPHGVIELSAIQIAGAAGLLLAQAILMPGRLKRSDALKENGRRAGVLMIGVAAMLCVAGTIEGLVTPQRTSELFRFSVGGFTAVLLFGYLALAGREERATSSVGSPP